MRVFQQSVWAHVECCIASGTFDQICIPEEKGSGEKRALGIEIRAPRMSTMKDAQRVAHRQ